MDYKHQYESMKKMVTMYQDEIVPGLWEKIKELEKQMPKWIPVSDRLPEKNQFILVYNIDKIVGEAFFDDDMEFYWANTDENELPEIVTHWMPLPEPPKENDNG